MVIIMRAVIGLTAVGRSPEFIGERTGPFLPSKIALLGEFNRERKCLSLPRLGEDRTEFVAR
jgi:hypothetical protein